MNKKTVYDFLITHYFLSICSPIEGATRTRTQTRRAGKYFNPRSHRGSDDFGQGIGEFLGISIHAPIEGATRLRRF